MADLSADYAGIEEGAGRMNTRLTQLAAELTTLQTQVNSLLGNGLQLDQASPVLRDTYEEFNSNLERSAANILEYAKMFLEIRDALQNNDADIVAAIISGQDGEGGVEVTGEHVETPVPGAR
ncbi:hypothetical protein [Streptomyces avicenniae]|uniref:hypothetical protein n=1 Tax=Streptomyces avicenniae TaxID=500153 RepID=UPI00069B725D|nr:hypothetical protein [Streptomyces avicenniae]